MISDGRKRVAIENVKPCIDHGLFPVKRVIGEALKVEADIFADGHEEVSALLLYRYVNDKEWREIPMIFVVNDLWTATFIPTELGRYYYKVEGWIDHFLTWQKDIGKKINAGQDVMVDLQIGAELLKQTASRAPRKEATNLKQWAGKLSNAKDIRGAELLAMNDEVAQVAARYPDRSLSVTLPEELSVQVDRQKARFSSWYEIFPRSFARTPGRHGTFRDCEKMLPQIADMGFDVLYLPPIHPIGKKNRKGKNNSPGATASDPGSPWAIGSPEGGHKSINPLLGTMKDFLKFVENATSQGLEVALDLAFQCAPDHPYVTEHPEWFKWRPDGTVQYAENPPKKYEDVLPMNFETENWQELWEELKSVVIFWIKKGIRIFRVDNPHTKPFDFWEWLISDIREIYPEVIFLAEAFTRPKVMYRLAKIGFSQSYTYFTWRNTKMEFVDYINDLTGTDRREFFRPCFWPNTPDILPEHLQFGNRNTFIIRFILAATLSSNYGIYAPAFELLENEPIPGKEEYLNSEKYEIKNWDLNHPGHLREIMKKVNRIRQENPALQDTNNIRFLRIENEYLLGFLKVDEQTSNTLLVLINMDPYAHQAGKFSLPLDELNIPARQSYLAHELLTDTRLFWQGENHAVTIDPNRMPAQIYRIQRRVKREKDFDYFM